MQIDRFGGILACTISKYFWEATNGLNQTKNGQKLVKNQFTPSRYPESRVTRAAEARAAAARMRASLVSMVAVVAGRGATRYWPGAGPAPCYRIPTLGPAQTLGSKEQYCNYHNSGSVFSGDWLREEEPGPGRRRNCFVRQQATLLQMTPKLYSIVNLFTYFTIDGFEAKI